MAGRLEGKVAVITGGANGIGRSTALRFLDEGARVVIGDLNPATAEEVVQRAAKAGHGERIRFIKTDVAEEHDVAAMIDHATSTFGRVDCVFNNAGVAGAVGPITHISVEDWDYTFGVLVRGVFLGMKHGARIMKAQGIEGSIISTASVAGLHGGDGPQAYSAAKAAVINLTRAVAVELAPARIRVNAICPGGINTPLLHRGNPELMEPMLQKLQPWPEVGPAGAHRRGGAVPRQRRRAFRDRRGPRRRRRPHGGRRQLDARPQSDRHRNPNRRRRPRLHRTGPDVPLHRVRGEIRSGECQLATRGRRPRRWRRAGDPSTSATSRSARRRTSGAPWRISFAATWLLTFLTP